MTPPVSSVPATTCAGDALSVSVTRPPGRQSNHRFPLAVEIAILVLAAVLGAIGMKALVAEVFSVPSGSMARTILPGQRIAIEKLSYDFRDPRRGEVVVFDGHGIFTDPEPGVHTFVKRVIAIGGDRVRCCDVSGKLTVNGVSLDESAYLAAGQAPSLVKFDVVVPSGSVWVMGDHRATSADSRAYLGSAGGGFVPIDRINGRALAVVWPLANAHSISAPTTFNAVNRAEPGSNSASSGS